MIGYFSSHLAVFGFQASSVPHNIPPNPANKKNDQSLSDFQTGIGAAAHATLNTEGLISDTRATIVETVALCRILIEGLFQLQKCMNYLLRFMTFWTVLCIKGLVIQPIF